MNRCLSGNSKICIKTKMLLSISDGDPRPLRALELMMNVKVKIMVLESILQCYL